MKWLTDGIDNNLIPIFFFWGGGSIRSLTLLNGQRIAIGVVTLKLGLWGIQGSDQVFIEDPLPTSIRMSMIRRDPF